MKLLPEKQALMKLAELRENFVRTISEGYEHKAAPCITCQTPGSCCLDAHFVNVHISRLEAVAIKAKLASLPPDQQIRIKRRIAAAIDDYGLTALGDTFEQKFACPLFERSVGCLVHADGKPVACTMHACYDNETDLPPDELQIAQEKKIDDLGARTYGRRDQWLPLPLAIR